MTAPWLNRFLLAALIWVIASFLIHELASLDIWWQLVIGEDILQRLEIPSINRYSAGALGQPYHDSHWLFQVLLAISHRLAELNGPLLLMILLWGLTLLFLYKETRANAGTGIAVLFTFLASAAATERFLPRPELITFLMIVAFYSLLRQGKYETPFQLALFTILQIIWLNSHGLFVIGPFMVGCYWFTHLIRYFANKENQLKALSILLALVSISLLASPYGTGALEYSYLLFTEVGQEAPEHMKAVNELSPTFGEAAMGNPAFWFYAVLLGLTPLSLALNLRRISPERLLIVAALCLASLTGRRNMVLFVLPAAPFIVENLAHHLNRVPGLRSWERPLKTSLAAGLLLCSSYALSGRYYLDMELPARFGLGMTPDFFPHQLVPFIKEHNIQGQVYNTNRLGGFYMYHFYPDRLPFIDGRWEVYGDAFFEAKRIASTNYAAWKEWTAGFGVNSALLHHTTAISRMLVPALYRDPDWSLVYYDFAASFFVRNDALGTAKPIVFSRESRLIEGAERIDGHLMLNVFYHNLGLKHLLLQNLERTLSFGYGQDKTRLKIAKLYLELNRIGQAEALYLEILDAYGEQVDALSDLALIHYQRQQYNQALSYTARAIKVAPDNADIEFNHALVLTAANRHPEATALLRKILVKDPNYQKAQQLLKQIDQ